ncbi:arsenate reductase ArsC [Deferrisoma camini]|uniref:arsenate reductase ArsC n=1 Tax=Deferrisoma camini TaxID=1035120 RepID=UPI00046D67B3|nr:arsenate reductase ArsC [Deferrisoma camini]
MTKGSKKRVLFLCTGNSCRSQMAEGWLRHLAGDRYEVFSAGTRPQGLNPLAVRVMAEAGVDISGHTSDPVEKYLGQDFDLVVTVCGGAKESCPVFVGRVKDRQHWPFDDPAGATGTQEQILAVFRRVRDEIRARVEAFLNEPPACPGGEGRREG